MLYIFNCLETVNISSAPKQGVNSGDDKQ